MKLSILNQFPILLIAMITFACGGGTNTESSTPTSPAEEVNVVETAPPVAAPAEEPKEEQLAAVDSQELTGEDKVANSDCLSCHMVERKVIGPSYQDVAAEYENTEANVAMLAKKIIEGGVGVWGEVAMPPHATLSEEDAKDMVRYILSIQAH